MVRPSLIELTSGEPVRARMDGLPTYGQVDTRMEARFPVLIRRICVKLRQVSGLGRETVSSGKGICKPFATTRGRLSNCDNRVSLSAFREQAGPATPLNRAKSQKDRAWLQ